MIEQRKTEKSVTFAHMIDEELKDKRIAVLLSGGVDSSVVVYELASRGLHPDCFYIKIGPEETEEWDCSSEEDLEMATAVALRYGCKLEVVDCHQEYWSQVTKYTMDKVRAGFTPNPDVMCNRPSMRSVVKTTISLPRAIMHRLNGSTGRNGSPPVLTP